jgi:hypothetical protein
MKNNKELEAELVEVRQAIRDCYALICRFKPASFERQPMPALQRVLGGEEQYEVTPEQPVEKLRELGTELAASLTASGRSAHAANDVCGKVTDGGAGEQWCIQPPGHAGPCKPA